MSETTSAPQATTTDTPADTAPAFDPQRRATELAILDALRAVVDPELTHSLPLKVTVVTGLDALSHAIEGYWSRNHQPICDEILSNHIVFYNEGGNAVSFYYAAHSFSHV